MASAGPGQQGPGGAEGSCLTVCFSSPAGVAEAPHLGRLGLLPSPAAAWVPGAIWVAEPAVAGMARGTGSCAQGGEGGPPGGCPPPCPLGVARQVRATSVWRQVGSRVAEGVCFASGRVSLAAGSSVCPSSGRDSKKVLEETGGVGWLLWGRSQPLRCHQAEKGRVSQDLGLSFPQAIRRPGQCRALPFAARPGPRAGLGVAPRAFPHFLSPHAPAPPKPRAGQRRERLSPGHRRA